MVPFSFPQPLLKSRVMKEHSSTIEAWMPQVWRLYQVLLPFPAFLLSLLSNLFFLFHLLIPKFWLLHNGVQHHAGYFWLPTSNFGILRAWKNPAGCVKRNRVNFKPQNNGHPQKLMAGNSFNSIR